MKAYITFYKKDGSREKVVLTLVEAKARLTAKQYEKLTDWNGIHTRNMDGYIA